MIAFSWFRASLAGGLMALLLSGCEQMTVDDYSEATRKLVLEEYFEGRTRAWGMFEDRLGNVRSEFFVDIDGRWDGERLVLTERFEYKDGHTEERVWTLVKTGPDTYTGTSSDVVGVAIGRAAGNAFNWRYDFNLPVGDSVWKVRFDDWMFLQRNGVVLNKATVSRWGIRIGTVFISFSKPVGTSDPIRSTARIHSKRQLENDHVLQLFKTRALADDSTTTPHS